MSPRFEPVITLGNAVTLAVWLGGIVWYMAVDHADLLKTSAASERHTQQIVLLEKLFAVQAHELEMRTIQRDREREDTKEQLRVINGKLDRLLERPLAANGLPKA